MSVTVFFFFLGDTHTAGTDIYIGTGNSKTAVVVFLRFIIHDSLQIVARTDALAARSGREAINLASADGHIPRALDTTARAVVLFVVIPYGIACGNGLDDAARNREQRVGGNAFACLTVAVGSQHTAAHNDIVFAIDAFTFLSMSVDMNKAAKEMHIVVGGNAALLVAVHIQLSAPRDADLALGKDATALVLAFHLRVFRAIRQGINRIVCQVYKQALLQLAVDDRALGIGEVHAVQHQTGFVAAVEFEARILAAARDNVFQSCCSRLYREMRTLLSHRKRVGIARYGHVGSVEDDTNRLGPCAVRQEVVVEFTGLIRHLRLCLHTRLVGILEGNVIVEVGKVALRHHFSPPRVFLGETHCPYCRCIETTWGIAAP